jgi:hypothetical protein
MISLRRKSFFLFYLKSLKETATYVVIFVASFHYIHSWEVFIAQVIGQNYKYPSL